MAVSKNWEGRIKKRAGRVPRNLKAQVFYREPLGDQLGERIDADAEVAIHEFCVDDIVAHGGFHAFRDHRLIGNDEEGAGRDFVMGNR